MMRFYNSFFSAGIDEIISKFVKLEDDIGFSGGKAAKWFRVELCVHTYSYPISPNK
jgi:hypothetical protein